MSAVTPLTVAEQALLRDKVARARLGVPRAMPKLAGKPKPDPRIAAFQRQTERLTALLNATQAELAALKAAHHTAGVELARLRAAIAEPSAAVTRKWLEAERHILKLRNERK